MENLYELKVRCAIVFGNEMLIVRHDINNVRRSHAWEIPMNTMLPSENLEGAAIRIAKEQTGLDVEVKRVLYASAFNPVPNKNVAIITYLCTTNTKEVLLNDFYDDFKWSKKSRLIIHIHSALAQDFRDYKVVDIPELQSEED